MPPAIPSLWPSDIMVDVRPPLEILKAQAEKLGEITRGILTAEVTTVTGHEDYVVHRLDLIAPKLDDRAHRILTATHRTDLYPVVVEAELYRPTKVPAHAVKNLALQSTVAASGVNSRTDYPLRAWPPADDSRPVASNQSDFLSRVSEVLRSPAVRAAIDSFIALSNEKNPLTDSETAA
ncbi:hypothetical protein [Frigoriglobus tundricola]|uniref:Uncharacterized protein n=1 Tax=Frigoriglobus tundricola TaxID=2774151 RepID=A0A6M5YRJ1_9BACT|nr:hypothetical protein [Frigoriglobus tundricola]QJW96050.1 hypothetical protein FTUN_3604 [Frigoriglobus tundricola]